MSEPLAIIGGDRPLRDADAICEGCGVTAPLDVRRARILPARTTRAIVQKLTEQARYYREPPPKESPARVAAEIRASAGDKVGPMPREVHAFLAEFGLGVVLPVLLLSWPRIRRSPTGLVTGGLLAVLGFVMHRLNVSVTGLERASGTHYQPSWMEWTVSIGLVAIAFAVFALAARYLPIFPAREAGSEAEPGAAQEAAPREAAS